MNKSLFNLLFLFIFTISFSQSNQTLEMAKSMSKPDLQISDLIDNLSKLGLRFKLNKSAKKYIATKGYDPRYGVRLLRREIQKLLEDPISEMLLKNTYSKGTLINVKFQKGQIIFEIKTIKKSSKKIS